MGESIEDKTNIEQILNSNIEYFNPNILSNIMQLIKRRDTVSKAYKRNALDINICINEIELLNKQIKQLLGL